MDLYEELEEIVKNIPTRFSEMEFVSTNIIRLDEMEDKEAQQQHRDIIFLLIWIHYQTRDINKTNKLPYGIDIFNKKKNIIRSDETEKNEDKDKEPKQEQGEEKKDLTETYKCILEKFPPTLQKLLLAYVKFYLVEDQ